MTRRTKKILMAAGAATATVAAGVVAYKLIANCHYEKGTWHGYSHGQFEYDREVFLRGVESGKAIIIEEATELPAA